MTIFSNLICMVDGTVALLIELKHRDIFILVNRLKTDDRYHKRKKWLTPKFVSQYT